jgi:hypothetical protein
MPQLVSSKVSLKIATQESDRTYSGFAPDVSAEALAAFSSAVNSIQSGPIKIQRKIVDNLYARGD